MSGVATGAGTRVDVTLKLSQLQNLCKRDPDGYREDYNAQVRRLESECKILALSSSAESAAAPRFIELIQFCAAVSSSSYKTEAPKISSLLIDLLSNSSSNNNNVQQLHRHVRKSSVSALILMRNKGSVEPLQLFELFFRILTTVPDKALKDLLYRHMVNDLCNMNKGKKNKKKKNGQENVNRSVQAFLHRIVCEGNDDDGEGDPTAARRATDMVCELYRRQVWTDPRTVAILASSAVSHHSTVATRAMRFFLNIEEKMLEDERRSHDEDWQAANQIDYHKFSKKTKKRSREVSRAVKNRKRVQVKKENNEWTMDLVGASSVETCKKLYPAIELLHDAQGLAETVFSKLTRANSSLSYEVKLLMMNFVTRLVGNHQLLLLPLYPFLQRYMGGHQRDVTAVLAYSVQACHEYVPPEEVYGILKTITHNFITERCSGEQMAVGINAARAICARVPSVLSVERDELDSTVVMDVEAFARDLAAYSNHRDRSVSIAGRGWTNFIREVHPSLLQGKDRGTVGSALHRAGERPMRYGQAKVSAGVEGADLLVEYESKKAAFLRKQEACGEDASDEGDSIQEEETNDEVDGDEWEEVEEDDGDDEDDNNSDDESAPDLILLKSDKASDDAPVDKDETVVDLSKMTPEEREELKQKVSSTRVFTAADFEKMRKLVEREDRAKRDPRETARRKRAAAKGQVFDELSDDDSEGDSDDDQVRVSGVVNPVDIMADSKRKRVSKTEKLEKIVAGRQKYEAKARAGGSTNTEKKRKKNFVMAQFSWATRKKGKGKATARVANKRKQLAGSHEAKKRRRKM